MTRYALSQLARMVIAGSVLFAVFYGLDDMGHSWRWTALAALAGIGAAWKLIERWWRKRA